MIQIRSRYFQYVICPFLFFSTSLSSQNLVLNPGFEDFECQRWYNSSIELCKDWSSPNLNSPDYFINSCPDYGVTSAFANTWWGYQLPSGGKAFAGFIAYHPEEENEYSSSAIEYLQGTLSESLISGVRYTFQFNISLSESSSLSLQNLGVLFSGKKTVTRKIKALTILPDLIIAITNDTSKWITVKQSFIAKGKEKYFVIGCFASEGKPKTKKVKPSNGIKMPRKEAYYYVDDFAVFSEGLETDGREEANTEKEISLEDVNKTKDNVKDIKVGEQITLENVFFSSGKSELLSDSFAELDKLVYYLTNHQQFRIQILGYTDSQGDRNDNLMLSKTGPGRSISI